MNRPTMDAFFEGGNFILKLPMDETHHASLVEEFDSLQFSGKTVFHKWVSLGKKRYLLEDFKELLAEKTRTPEMRRIITLEEVVAELTERIVVLEEKSKAPLQLPAPIKRRRTSEEARANLVGRIEKWWKRLEEGDAKIKEMDSILKIVGLGVANLQEAMMVFGTIPKNKIRSVTTLEAIYDQYGADGFRQIFSTIAALEPKEVRKDYIAAIRYCLFLADKPMNKDDIYVAAIDYFTMDWSELDTLLRKYADKTKKLSRGAVLGKLITGEIQETHR